MTFFGRSAVLLVKDKKITSSTSSRYSKLLKKIGTCSAYLIAWDITMLSCKIYTYTMMISIKLDIDKQIWLDPDSSKIDILARLKK